ncbi:flavin reductase family protein [Streptomyces sp. NPDC052101]|uniref:flavin reductase family protein n=1 Tax=Streptomyces sp. NPDC052101 TaxID=3155763 RepID=UPI0034467D9A
MTVNSFTTLSLSPPLVSFSVQQSARIRKLIEVCGGFVVNILAAEQAELARWFADRDRPTGADSFTGVDTADVPSTGGIRLAGTIGHFTCRTVQLIDAGDHTIVIGSVMDCASRDRAPQLLFADGKFHALGHPPQ